MRVPHLLFFLVTVVSAHSAQVIATKYDHDVSDFSQATPLADCGGFLSSCQRDRDCCSDIELKCDERFCTCREDWWFNPVNKKCERLPDLDDDDDDTLVIALSVTGGVLLLLAIAAGVFFYNKKRKSRRSPYRSASSPAASAPQPVALQQQLPNPATLGHVDAVQSHGYLQPGVPEPSAPPPSYSDAVGGSSEKS